MVRNDGIAEIFSPTRSARFNTVNRNARSRIGAVRVDRIGGDGKDVIILPVNYERAGRVFHPDGDRPERS